MDLRIEPANLSGSVVAPASKSIAQRLLILASVAEKPTFIEMDADLSDDVEATARCLSALGVRITALNITPSSPEGPVFGLRVSPLPRDPSGRPVALTDVELDCGESGATLRFLLPFVAALGTTARFTGRGRLPERPLSPLAEEMERHGAKLTPEGERALPLRLEGQLRGGTFNLAGDVSSQFISGLLLAGPLLGEGATVAVNDPFESKPYVKLTCQALEAFGVTVASERGITRTEFSVEPQRIASPEAVRVEGDWSQAAFWLSAGALGADVCVEGLNLRSAQGDRACMGALALMGVRVGREGGRVQAASKGLRAATLDLRDMPDLICPLAPVAALAAGTSRFTGVRRLRLKESDRLRSVAAALCALGGKAEVVGDELVLEGVGEFSGGTVDAAGDHRVAMMAAVCSLASSGPVTIVGAECVDKSYPMFFDVFEGLGGRVQEV